MIVFNYGERNAKQNGVAILALIIMTATVFAATANASNGGSSSETAENAEHKLQAYIGR